MPPGCLLAQPLLEELDLSRIGLSSFPADALSLGRTLRVLRLAGNKIAAIPDAIGAACVGKLEELELMADDVADVLLELIAAEEHGLPVYVSLLFPHRSGGGSESKAERFIDQLAMTTLELENRISTAHAVAAAASSSCGTAISGSSGEAGADAGSTGEENAWFRRKVCWASSQW